MPRIEFSNYIGEHPYDRLANPDGTPLRRGDFVNCMKLLHGLELEMGIQLQPGMWLKEILEDQRIFEDVDIQTDPLKGGDIVIFGQAYEDRYKLHGGMYIGEVDKDIQPKIIHATNSSNNNVALWPLNSFSNYPQYERIYGVKRHIPEIYTVFVAPCFKDPRVQPVFAQSHIPIS